MPRIFGIHLGTTYSSIATLNKKGEPEIICNEAEGEYMLASAVYFQPGGNPVVGSVAKEQAIIEPDRVVQFIKREMGKSIEKRNFDGQEYDPIDISAIILKRMKEYAEESFGEEVKDVIITCPAYFGAEEKMATKQAGTMAGLNVIDIIEEPVAVALSYCFKEHVENQKVLVYNLGGNTFDITLLDLSIDENSKKAVINVMGSEGINSLGGINWDARLFELISSLYLDETGMEFDKEAQLKVKEDIEAIKKRLSRKDSHSFTIRSNGDSDRIEVTERMFREATADLTDQTVSLVNDVFSKHSLTPDDINIVLLAGGSSRMPMIIDAVGNIFPGKIKVKDPDFAVAKGASLAALYLLGMNVETDNNVAQKNESVNSFLPQKKFEAVHSFIKNNNEVKEFSKVAEEFDFFDLTGLKFDPPVRNADAIIGAIESEKAKLRGSFNGDYCKDTERKAIVNYLDKCKKLYIDGSKVSYAFKQAAQEKKKKVETILRMVASVKYNALNSSNSSDVKFSISDGTVKEIAEDMNLTWASARKIYEEVGFTVEEPVERVYLKEKLPKFTAELRFREIQERINSLRQFYIDSECTGKHEIRDLYGFAAYVNSEMNEVEAYRYKSTKSLCEMMHSIKLDFPGTTGDDRISLYHDIAAAAKIYVFKDEESRCSYDLYIKYHSKELSELYKILKMLPVKVLTDTDIAEAFIQKIIDYIPDFEVATAVYNKEAGLLTASPYLPEVLKVRFRKSQSIDKINANTDGKEMATEADLAKDICLPFEFHTPLRHYEPIRRSYGVGIIQNDHYMVDNVITLDMMYPAVGTRKYAIANDNQGNIRFSIFENRSADAYVSLNDEEHSEDPSLSVKKISEIDIPLKENTKKGTIIEIQFRRDSDGLTIKVIELDNNIVLLEHNIFDIGEHFGDDLDKVKEFFAGVEEVDF